MLCINPYYLSLHDFLNKVSFIVCNFLLLGNQLALFIVGYFFVVLGKLFADGTLLLQLHSL